LFYPSLANNNCLHKDLQEEVHHPTLSWVLFQKQKESNHVIKVVYSLVRNIIKK